MTWRKGRKSPALARGDSLWLVDGSGSKSAGRGSAEVVAEGSKEESELGVIAKQTVFKRLAGKDGRSLMV